MRKQKSSSDLKIAKERIDILFKQAKIRPEKATRYVFIARKIAKKYNIKLDKKLKRTFCHHCYSYFTSENLKVRTNPKTKCVEYNCLDCKKVTRYGYRNEN
jgi:ribonuclease P protein subunit RPR2